MYFRTWEMSRGHSGMQNTHVFHTDGICATYMCATHARAYY